MQSIIQNYWKEVQNEYMERQCMNTVKKEIVKTIQKMAGSYTPYHIFSDWVKLCAISTQNSIQQVHDKVWDSREKQYIETINRYNGKEQKNMAYMYGMLAEAFENEMTDILGEIYMESGCGSKNAGQYFTPFHVSYLAAQLGTPKNISEDNKLYINEPSAGGGGLVIASAKVLKDRGIDYQKCMEVKAKDLDWNGVYMTYVQLSILGISATVVHGDALGKPEMNRNSIFYTPKKMGAIL